ncbi:MAG: DUF3800 domain-containing protein [Actinobacteria bacterium]|nr:DUF3800 domain-containing protein [Actinomycetota bacterium]
MPTRDFVFVDEHGDPGLPGHGSSHYACLSVHVTDESLEHVVECFAHLRFYRQVYKEVKNLDDDPRLRPTLAVILLNLSRAHDVRFNATFVDKAKYTGPYLAPGEGTRFRNFQLRRLLEWHFEGFAPVTNHCELVLDRHSHSHRQLENLRGYLNGNYRLPAFSAITTVDSRYVEMIKVADLALRLFRRQTIQHNPGWLSLDLSFIRAVDVTKMHKHWAP